VGCEGLERFFVLGDERLDEITDAEDECVAPGLESEPTAEVGFEQHAMLCGSGEFEAWG